MILEEGVTVLETKGEDRALKKQFLPTFPSTALCFEL